MKYQSCSHGSDLLSTSLAPTAFTFPPVLSLRAPTSRWTGSRGMVHALWIGLSLSVANDVRVFGGPPSVPSCTPELVYTVAPGTLNASGSGVANAAQIQFTDAEGTPLPETDATIEWTARAVVKETGIPVGAAPSLGGSLELIVTTGTGERLTFRATCMAGVGAYSIDNIQGIVIYANGITTGWPGSAARRTFVHFEAWQEGDEHGVYLALVDGRDCVLNFSTLLVTPAPAIGTGSFTGLLDHGFVYSETACAARFGSPIPPTRAPGLQRHISQLDD